MRRTEPDLVFSDERANLAFMRQIALRWQSTDGLEKISIAETTVMTVTWKEVFPALPEVLGNNGPPQTSSLFVKTIWTHSKRPLIFYFTNHIPFSRGLLLYDPGFWVPQLLMACIAARSREVKSIPECAEAVAGSSTDKACR